MFTISKKLISIWNSYWFENYPARKSLAIIRIATYICILQSLAMIWNITDPNIFLHGQNPSWYSPVGLLQLLGSKIPSIQFFITLKYLSLISSLLALIGLFTFPSSIVSFISNQFLFCVLYSWGQPWTHGFNIIFLLQLSILFSPTGGTLSIDRLINQSRNKLIEIPAWKCTWAVRLAQLTVALMFLNGFFYKWLSSPFELRWAFSDNLRNIITAEYFQQNVGIPNYIIYIVNHPFLYKTVALLNLLTQFSIIFSCIFIRKPWLRLLIGLLVVLEFAGFKILMNLESYYWYGLAAVFVDWDYFIALLKKINLKENFYKTSYPIKEGSFVKRAITFFIICFTGFYVIIAFNPRYGLQEKLKPYPFTRFALYNLIEAQKPYNIHQPWPFNQLTFKVYINSDYNDSASHLLNSALYLMPRFYYSENNKSKFLTQCEKVLQKAGYSNITSIELFKAYYQIPPYPHKPTLQFLSEELQCGMTFK